MATKRKDEAAANLEAPEVAGVEFLTPEQSRARFDELARLKLGISGAEFARRWEAGEYAADPEAVVELAVLLPMAR